MNSDTLADSRVPTFIQYDVEKAEEKKKTKRKRTNEATRKPKTKRAKKDQATATNGVADNSVNIWVGAVVEDNLGAYGIYFAENDHRNTAHVFQIEDVLQDEDYVSVLGALKALENSQQLEAPINLYTSYRDLPRVAVGKRGSVVYPDMITKIKALIANKKEGVNVQYMSGRTASPEHNASVELAVAALRKEKEGDASQNEESPVTQEVLSQEIALEDMIVETVTKDDEKDALVDEATVEEVAVKSHEIVIESNDVEEEEEEEESKQVEKEKIVESSTINGIVEQTETPDAVGASVDTITEAPEAESTTITKVTTVVEETIEITKEEPVDTVMREVSSLCDMDEDSSNETPKDSLSTNDELIQETTPPSSWNLGFRNVWDLLTSPFKSSRK